MFQFAAMSESDDRTRAAIRAFMRARKLKPRPWALRAGVSEGALRNYLSGRSATLTTRTVERLAKAADASVTDVLGLPKPDDAQRPRDFVKIRSVRVSASLGGGTLNEHEAEGDPFYFRRSFCEGELKADPSELRMIWLKGDSMEPTLHDRDIALVHLIDKDVKRGGLFAFDDGTGLSVKRLQIIGGKPVRLRIIADNPLYQPYDVDFEGVHIAGRVVWRGGRVS